MINEYIRYRIDEGQRAAFLDGYAAAAKHLEASPHCLGYELSHCTEDGSAFILRIHWTSEEAHLQGFRKSAQFPPFLAAIRAFVPNIEEMRHYALTDVRWSRQGS
jgi:quinol monooxygenase YgiN